MSDKAGSINYYMTLPYGERVMEEVLGDGSSYYVARVVELEGCTSHGDTPDEALWNLQDAKHLYIRTMLEDGLNPPLPQKQAVRRTTWIMGAGSASVSCWPAHGAHEPDVQPRIVPPDETSSAPTEVSASRWSLGGLLAR